MRYAARLLFSTNATNVHARLPDMAQDVSLIARGLEGLQQPVVLDTAPRITVNTIKLTLRLYLRDSAIFYLPANAATLP